MGITVIPSYRVVTTFARQARKLPAEEALSSLEDKLREYVRNQFSMLHQSIMDLGERSVITQLGDPDLDRLIEALGEIEKGQPKSVVERALAACSERLPRPDLNARVLLLPGDGESGALVRQMKGVLGFSLGARTMVVFLWPVDGWEQWLAYTVTHEYVHLVRNLLFPRAPAAGKLVYLKTQEPETLLDAMVVEGTADAFATLQYPDMHPPWTDALPPPEERRLWPRVRRRFHVSDPAEIRRVLFGDNDRVPLWTGYTFGYRIVKRYLDDNPGTHPAKLVGLRAGSIYEATGYQPAP